MRSLIILALLFGFTSCNQTTEKTTSVTTDENTPEAGFEMYKMSEMASLMEKMAKEHEVVKEKILKGDTLGVIPKYYYDIHFASFTDEADNDEVFKNWAKLYINTEEQLYAASDNVADVYNSAVNVCIQCHTQKCGGPIPRIKKLLIK